MCVAGVIVVLSNCSRRMIARAGFNPYTNECVASIMKTARRPCVMVVVVVVVGHGRSN